MAYVKYTYKSITYYKWEWDNTPISDYVIKIDWQPDYKIEDLVEIPRDTPIAEGLLVSNFKLETDKPIEVEVDLKYIDFKGSFIIKKCIFKKPFNLSFIEFFGKCEITGNTFNSYCSIRHTSFKDNAKIDLNAGKYLSLIYNYFENVFYYIGNQFDKPYIYRNSFIEFSKLKDNKDNNIIWYDFHQSMCNFKAYYLSRHDYLNSQFFERLERKAHFKHSIYRKNLLIVVLISIDHFIKYFIKYIYLTLVFLATLSTIVGAFFTFLSYIKR